MTVARNTRSPLRRGSSACLPACRRGGELSELIRCAGLAACRRRAPQARHHHHLTGQYVELRDGSLVLDTPKTAAGVRTVHIPPHLLEKLRAHLDTWTTEDSSVIFATARTSRSAEPPGDWSRCLRGTGSACRSSASTACGTPGTRWQHVDRARWCDAV